MSKKNIEKFSDIIRLCYDDNNDPIECDDINVSYESCHINDENETPVDCPLICVDENNNEIDCDFTINISNEEWKNNLLYSQMYCRSDCNGIISEDENGNILECDTSIINNLDEYNKRLNTLDATVEMVDPKQCNIDKVIPEKRVTYYHTNEELLNSKLKYSLDIYKQRVNTSNNSTSDPLLIENFNDDSEYKYINKTIQNIVNLEDKTLDVINSISDNNKLEHFTNKEDFNNNLKKTFRKYTNFVSMAMEVESNYKDAILDENNGITQKDASFIMRATYQSFKNDGTVYDILGTNNNIEQFERLILEKTNVDLTEEVPVNGVTVDENGNVLEHRYGRSKCYLITALTKHQHLSLGQVYQLRKLMLKSFNNHSNRKFFSFYYENFKPIADMLVKENKLVEILPNMLKCIELVKKGLFDEAFEQYILTARQAYMICRDMGMDTVELEEKWDRLDGYISELPEPNNLFVEKSFEKAISVSN